MPELFRRRRIRCRLSGICSSRAQAPFTRQTPERPAARRLYLDAGSRAGFDPPAAGGRDTYVSDPAKPVPFLPRPMSMGDPDQWRTWLVHDQRFVDGRPDVLTYRTAPLTAPVHVKGAPVVDLYAATSGTDSDWVVKLIDVAPDTTAKGSDQGAPPSTAGGLDLPIGVEIFRGRYVHGFATPGPLTSNKPERYRWPCPTSTTFPCLDTGSWCWCSRPCSRFPIATHNASLQAFRCQNRRLHRRTTDSLPRRYNPGAIVLPTSK